MTDKNIEEKAKEHANDLFPHANDIDAGSEQALYWNCAKFGYKDGYTQAITDQQATLTKYKEALRETATELEKVFMDWFPYDDEIEIHRIGAIVDKAKQLLNNE